MESADLSEQTNVFGLGVYSLREAARLVQLPTRTVRRWVAGYDFRGKKGDLRFSKPMLEPDLERVAGIIELTFLDVIELLFIHNFQLQGVSLYIIRKASQ